MNQEVSRGLNTMDTMCTMVSVNVFGWTKYLPNLLLLVFKVIIFNSCFSCRKNITTNKKFSSFFSCRKKFTQQTYINLCFFCRKKITKQQICIHVSSVGKRLQDNKLIFKLFMLLHFLFILNAVRWSLQNLKNKSWPFSE